MLNESDHWYPHRILHHRFMIAVSRVADFHDGRRGSAPDPLVWDQGSKRKTDIRVNVDLASLPGPPGFLKGPWIQVHCGCITGADVAAWPDSVSIFMQIHCILGTLQWPAGAEDLGHFGSSFLEVLILLEQWCGHWLLSEKVTRPHVRANRPLFLFLLLLFQKESKLGRVASSSAAWLDRWACFLVELVGSYLVGLVLLCPGCGIWGGAVFAWVDLQAVGELSSPLPEGCLWRSRLSNWCSCGAFGWNA